MEEKISLLNRKECSILRGIAILAIITNNFGHQISGVFQDNEFTFDYEIVNGFVQSLNIVNEILPFNILSFYSPFGVMLFIFLSGYGLTLKYERNKQPINGSLFVSKHYSKLFVMQAKGLSIFYVIYLIYNRDTIVYFLPLIKQLLLIGNITDSPITPGPYWFFGMIMEMYVIYRFFLYLRSSRYILFIIVLSLLLMGLFASNDTILNYLRINCVMAILPFGLGILTARHINTHYIISNSHYFYLSCFLISFTLLTISKFNFYSWLIMPVFIISTALSMVKLLSNIQVLSNLFNWLGGLSGILFVIHPTIREIILPRVNLYNHPYEILIYFFLTIVLSVILKPVFNRESVEKRKQL